MRCVAMQSHAVPCAHRNITHRIGCERTFSRRQWYLLKKERKTTFYFSPLFLVITARKCKLLLNNRFALFCKFPDTGGVRGLASEVLYTNDDHWNFIVVHLSFTVELSVLIPSFADYYRPMFPFSHEATVCFSLENWSVACYYY